MEKDSLANLTSFGALGMVFADIQSVLTIVLLLTAIVLNVQRFRKGMREGKKD